MSSQAPVHIPSLHRAYRAVLVALAYPGRAVPVAPTTGAAMTLVLLSTWEPGSRVALAGAPRPLPWEAVPVAPADADLHHRALRRAVPVGRVHRPPSRASLQTTHSEQDAVIRPPAC